MGHPVYRYILCTYIFIFRYTTHVKRVRKYQKSIMVKLYCTAKSCDVSLFITTYSCDIFPYKLSTKMLTLSKFCLKTCNLQNTAINVIIIKRLLHLRSSHTEVSLRLTLSGIQRIFHGKASIRKCYATTLQTGNLE